MAKYENKAFKLQRGVIFDEKKIDGYSDFYDEGEVNKAIVHTRQDIVLIVSHLMSVNDQLKSIKWCLIIIIAINLRFCW